MRSSFSSQWVAAVMAFSLVTFSGVASPQTQQQVPPPPPPQQTRAAELSRKRRRMPRFLSRRIPT